MEPDPVQINTILSIFNPIEIDNILELLFLIILLFLSGMVSGSEVAFFALDPQELENLKKSTKRGEVTSTELLDKPKLLLATILIANNFINIAIVILSTALISSIFNFGNQVLLGFLIQVILVTFLILLFGEVLPKVYAVRNKLQLTSITSVPLLWLRKIFYPFSMLLVKSTSIIDKSIKSKVENISVDNLSHALELTTDENTGEEEKRILEGIVNFGNTDVKQIMISRIDVFALEYSESFESVRKQILEAGFSRIPVYRENFDKIEGILYVKDLLPYTDENDKFEWQKLLRPPFFVPENKKIDDLLNEIKERKTHLVVVVDEYGGTSGIATLEDIIEEIVGEISSEFDDDEIVYSKLSEQSYIFEGKTPLKDFYRITESPEESFESEKGDSDTIAGFIIEIAGRIPEKGETVLFQNFEFTIEAADQRKISTLKVTIKPIDSEEENSFNETE